MTIYENHAGQGASFTAYPLNNEPTTSYNVWQLGEVRNDRTSSVKCICEKKFHSIEYPEFSLDNLPPIDETTSPDVEIDRITVQNTCDPRKVRYAKQ